MIENGEKFKVVAKVSREFEEIPTPLVNSSLPRIESDTLSEVDIAIRDALQDFFGSFASIRPAVQ